MSHVTNIVLLYRIDDPVLKHVNEWLGNEGWGSGLVQVDHLAGGPKAFEANIAIGAYNYLNIPEFLKAVWAAPCGEYASPEDRQVAYKDEHDDEFRLVTGPRS